MNVTDGWLCPGCGVALSLLPEGHGFFLDDSGATVCGAGVRPMEYRMEAWGAGSASASAMRPVSGACATCGKPVPGGGHTDACTGLVPGSETISCLGNAGGSPA